MLTVLALAMIILFIVLLSMKKLSVFTSLTLVPFVFGIIAVLVTDHSIMDMFTWIQEGVFFSVDPEKDIYPYILRLSKKALKINKISQFIMNFHVFFLF